MKWILLVLFVAILAPAWVCAESNPDLPYGGIAVEMFYGALVTEGYSYNPPLEAGLFAPYGERRLFNAGAALIVPVTARATVFLGLTHHDETTDFSAEQSGDWEMTYATARVRFYLW